MIQTGRIPWGDLFALAATRLALSASWRTDRQLAMRLDGFAATEAGSALDMVKAAELVDDPKLRRLFLRHATDEARHAFLFRAAARSIHPDGARALPEHALIRATRQNLLARLGLARFLAFVHLSERRAARQFELIRAHHVNRPAIARLFDQVLRDERFHVSYSGKLLVDLARTGQIRSVRWLLARARADAAWQAWRRAGHAMGEVAARLLVLVVWAMAVPLFSIAERMRSAPSGWQSPTPRDPSLERARSEA